MSIKKPIFPPNGIFNDDYTKDFSPHISDDPASKEDRLNLVPGVPAREDLSDQAGPMEKERGWIPPREILPTSQDQARAKEFIRKANNRAAVIIIAMILAMAILLLSSCVTAKPKFKNHCNIIMVG